MSDTQNVLDAMTASIMGMKQEKATQLTPVGMESNVRSTFLDAKGDIFPHDEGIQSQVIHSSKIIRENLFQMQAQLAGIESCLLSIEREAGLAEPLPPISPPPEEKAPDIGPSFEEKFAAQQADAQRQAFAAAFAVLDAAPVATTPPVTSGAWTCPEHGDKHLVTLTSRKGRKYGVCSLAACPEFERIA